MENTFMREKHERLLERFKENPLVLEAPGKVYDAVSYLIWALLRVMVDMEDEDERTV